MASSQTIDLGLILTQFKDFEFSIETYAGRDRLQKFIYLLQAHNIYLGYDYSWYISGPYCTTLAKHAHALETIHGIIPADANVKFMNGDTQRRFIKFQNFISGNEGNDEYLKIAASLHLLKLNGMSDDDALEKITKDESFDHDYCKRILSNVKVLLTEFKLGNIKPFLQNKMPTVALFNDDKTANSRDMDHKPADKSIYYMLKDAIDTDIYLVGEHIFRREEPHPVVDMLITDKIVQIRELLHVYNF